MTTEARPMPDTSHDGSVADDDAVDDAGSPAPARRRWSRWLPWAVALLCLALAAWSTWQWREHATWRADVDASRAAAVAFTTELTNWDAADGLEDEIASLRDRGTGPFLDEIDVFFGGDELTAQLQADEVSATGEIEEAFVQDLRDDQSEVFVIVSVTYDSPRAGGGLDPVTFPASLVLEKQDGTWLVREVTVPNTPQLGQMIAPPAEGS